MSRSLAVLPLLALLAVAGPPTARAQAPLTVGAAKLTERVAAECRRVGADDEQCASVVARRVVRSEIAAYNATALSRTLAFERRLGDVLPLADAPVAGTHNAFNSTSEPTTVSHTDSNQQLTMTEQLDLGMRSLELDVHWIPSPRAGGAFAPVLCHGSGAAGCSTERLLSERLPEVARWLDANPTETLLLYLEDQIDDPAGYAASAKVVTDVLGGRMMRPAGPGCTNLPLDLTRRAMRAARKQVIITGDCGTGAWQGISHAWPSSVRLESGPEGFGTYPACGGPKVVAARPKIVRFFEDSTFLSTLTAAPALDDPSLTPAVVREMVRCGVDLLGFDQLVPSDERFAALAWSWADGPPAAGDPTCTRRRAVNGRWVPQACNARLRPSCRKPDGGWTVLSRPTTRAAAGPACRRSGALFRSPRTGFQNQLIGDAATGGADVWIAYRPSPPARR